MKGIDLSTNSINYAKKEAQKRNLDIEYVNENYLEYESDEKFDLVTMIFCDFCVLSKSQRKTLLTNMKKSMKKDTHLFIDLITTEMFKTRKETTNYQFVVQDGFWFGEAYHEFKTEFKYEDEKVSLDKYVIIRENETTEVYNWLKYFTLEEIKSEFKENGLEIIEVYSDVAGKEYDESEEIMAIVAKLI